MTDMSPLTPPMHPDLQAAVERYKYQTDIFHAQQERTRGLQAVKKSKEHKTMTAQEKADLDASIDQQRQARKESRAAWTKCRDGLIKMMLRYASSLPLLDPMDRE